MTLLIKTCAFIAIAYFATTLALYFGQRKLIYHPDPTHVLPQSLGLENFTEEKLATPDGVTLVTWQAPQQPGFPTLLYFHGNAGTLAGRGGRLHALNEAGFGISIMSYRGYSGSTGTPSEDANKRDARLVYDRLRERGTPPDDIIVYGESIGSGVATHLANDVQVGGLILDSPFTALVDRAAELYPWMPVRPFVTDRYPVADIVNRIDAPLLVIHGALDNVIPSTMGEAVFAAAKEPKTLKVFPQGNHSDLFNHGALDSILAFAKQVRTTSE